MSELMLGKIDYYYSIRPCLGERVSGDAAVVEEREQWVFVAIIDALGHGAKAHQVSCVAQDYLKRYWSEDVCRTMELLHRHLKGSLGAAVALAAINLETQQMFYTGVGNTVIRVLRRQQNRGSTPKLYSVEGIVGSQIKHSIEQTIQLNKSDTILLYTDGIQERFLGYPLIFTDDVMTITKKVIRSYGKNYDDATCIALKFKI